MRDAFIGREATSFADLPHGATVGSSSLRRQAQIRRQRPDLKVVMYRGNVQTRLRKLAEGVVDATLLAQAGLKRLGLEHVATSILPETDFLPAPGQGAICIECREDDDRVEAMLAPIAHRDTGIALACERAFLAALDGSCRTPIAGHAVVDGDGLRFTGMILRPDGSEAHEVTGEGATADAEAIGRDAGARVRATAGAKFFEDWS